MQYIIRQKRAELLCVERNSRQSRPELRLSLCVAEEKYENVRHERNSSNECFDSLPVVVLTEREKERLL